MGIRNLGFVEELVKAFNVNNYGSKVNTNFAVEGNNIVIKFNCDEPSAKRYLSQMAKDLVREYFLNEDVARHVFDLESFPFKFNQGTWTSSKGETKFTVSIKPGVIFNLKVHFAEWCRIDVKRQMINEIYKDLQYNVSKERIEELLNNNIQQLAMGTSSRYMKCLFFNDPGIQEHFERVLQTKMQKYGYNYLDFYHIDGNKIYFKDVENIDFIRSVTELSKKRIGYHFRFPSSNDLKVRNYKDVMGELIFRLTGIPICGYYRDSFIDRNRISNGDNFAIIPAVKDGHGGLKYLDYMQADKINVNFSHDVLTNVRGQTENTQSDRIGEVYAFSDRQIALLIPVIIENSVINKDGQLEINPELLEQLRSQPPLTDMSDTKLESPKHNQEKQIKESPRQGSEQGARTETGVFSFLHHTVVPSSQSWQSIGADENVQKADIWLQQKNPWLLQGTHEDKWLQSPQPGPSGFLSQQRPSLWPQGGHSSRTSAWPRPMDPGSSPAPSGDIPGFWSPAQVDSRGKPLTEKEEELIKALLYAFNLNNYILECPNTNFIVENGKIASSINDGVNVKEYLQELRDCTIKEYCGTEKEAKEAYDLNEFPFKFLSNCEKNQETTVVANISRGALFNLKKLFIQQKHEQRIGIGIEDININIIEKKVKSQKDRWVDSQVKGGDCGPKAAIKTCYPDESNLKHIPIIKDKGGYCLDRTYDTWEVKSFMEERRHAKGTSKAEKTKPEDNKDSGYSSGFATDAESGFSEVQTDDEKAMSNPSGKQGKSNAVDADESSRSGKFSKAKSEEDRVSSKSGSESTKKHGGGRFCKERSKSNSSSGSNTSSEPLEPSVSNTDDRAESKSPEKEQNFLQRTLSGLLRGSKESSSVHSPSNDNIGGSAETSAPFVRNNKGRCSMISSISDFTDNKQSPFSRQYSVPNRGIQAGIPTDKLLNPSKVESEFGKFLQDKSGPGSIATSGYASMCSSLESFASDNDPTLSNTLGRTTSGFLPPLKFEDGFVYVPKLKQEDAVKAKKHILEYFINHLVFRKDKESEKAKMLELLSSPTGIERLYAGFSSLHKREQLYSKLYLSFDDGKQLVELVWHALHQKYVENLYLSDQVAALDQSRQPDKAGRFSGKFSQEDSPDTSGGIKKQLPFVPCSQTQLTGPSSFSAMQYAGARKKITGESDICPTNPWAVPGTAFVPDSVSHVKSDIDKLGENFSRAIKVTGEGKLGSSELEPRHQLLDRERHRRSTKQATEEESISNWVWR